MKNIVSKIILVISATLMVLLISACKKAEDPSSILPPEQISVTPTPEMSLDVQTNFDMLMPFVPLHSLHTRLHEGALPYFIPSNDYGMLLPYSSAIVVDEGSMFVSKYGLVTIDGVVVTDLIYDGIDRAEYIYNWYVGTENDKLPAYKLFIHDLDPETAWGYYNNRKMAACALDGSWITEFDYIDIIFTSEVILLYRDDLTFDIDVIDYDGNHMYNMLDFDWANNAQADSLTGRLIEIISDRYAHVRIRNNTYAFIDLLTGNSRSTRFIAADPFIEGHAPVGVGISGTYYVIWGLINTDFEVIVQPKYYSMPFFIYGKAIVQRRDDSQFVINPRGEILFDVPNDYWLDHSYDGPTFIMYSKFGTDPYPTYLTSEFEEIIPPETMESNDFYLRYLNNGWYTIGHDAGSYLIRENESFYFPGVDYISFFDDDLFLYETSHVSAFDTIFISGIMTLDGKVVISPEPDVDITPVIQNENLTAFIINTDLSWYYPGQEYNPSTYRLVDTNGSTKLQGRGILTYHEELELYSLQSENYFSWLDKDANQIITIPFLSYAFD